TLRIASTQALIDVVIAALPSPPLPPLPPSLYIPPPVNRRDGIPESEQPPRKRLCLSTLGSSETIEVCPQGEIKKLEIELWNLKKLRTYAERQTDNKRKVEDSSRNNHGHQQQPFKRQNVAKVYNMGTGERKPYGGNMPKSTGNTNVANTQKGNRVASKGNGCFECGAPGNFKRYCPKLKNKDGGNGNAQG
ncbi:reverse transcriptase domain-containing protein, partial [Tanacetum coccineum]